MMNRLLLGRGAPAPAQFVSGENYNSSEIAQYINLSGYIENDLVMIFCVSPSTDLNPTIYGGNGGVWSGDIFQWSELGYIDSAFWKILNSSDISGVTLSGISPGNNIQVVGYRGASSAHRVSISQSSSTDDFLTIQGFQRNRLSRTLVSRVTDRDVATEMAKPSADWSIRIGPYSNGSWSSIVSELDSKYYPDNSAITWTNFQAMYQQVGFVYELR